MLSNSGEDMKARNADLASSVLAFVRMNPFNDNGESAISFFQSEQLNNLSWRPIGGHFVTARCL